MTSTPRRVTIVEVGPRDGLQNERVSITTADKIEFVNRLSAAGLPVIEVSAFVSPKWVPQMADAAEVFAGITRAAGHPLHRARAEPGRPRSRDRGRRHRNRGLRRVDRDLQPQEHQPEHRRVARRLQAGLRPRARGRPARARLSVDRVRLPVRRRRGAADVADLAARLVGLGVFEVAVSDTIGIAHPGQVPRVLDAVLARVPVDRIALHFHDTRGTALANVLAALPFGVATFDASAGGLGGCPYAPGAAGNLATDDLIYMLDGLGIETGVSLAGARRRRRSSARGSITRCRRATRRRPRRDKRKAIPRVGPT